MHPRSLPSLLYIGDVPIESTLAGATLLYRLLQDYPSNKLCIVENSILPTQPERRLHNVRYYNFSFGIKRLLHSRFHFSYTSYLILTAACRSTQLTKTVSTFQPDAILTVAHGFSWLTAAAIAEKYQVPLHLIIHDDWPSYIPVLPGLRNWVIQIFGRVYRQAQSHLCISPYMMQFYQKHYGIEGKILYPLRAADAPSLNCLPTRLWHQKFSLNFVYAGSVNSQGYVQSLVSLASALEPFGHQLIVYSPLTEAAVQQIGLNRPNVTIRSLIPSHQLIETLREQADVLFVPMSFEASDRPNMEMSFPSKLTDYTIAGVPLLIWGPAYCSAIRWAKDNPGVAEVVEESNLETLSSAIERLSKDPKYRQHLAQTALETGSMYFSYEKGIETFYRAIAKQ